MTFTEYQLLTKETAMYPGQGSIEGLCYTGLGLGEAGEVQGKIKKILRDDGGKITEGKREQIVKELGDVLWYVAQTATELNVILDSIAMKNIVKLRSRKERGTLQGSGDNR